jgi:Zn-finger nucleic acid-binding protein
MMLNCPVCNSALKKFVEQGRRNLCECPRCGPYSISIEAQDDLPSLLSRGKNSSARLSHALYHMTKREQWAFVTTTLLQNILDNTELPRPQEQLENLILWLGDTQPNMGATIEAEDDAIAAVGMVDMPSLGFLVSQAIGVGLLKGEVVAFLGGACSILSLQLTLSGWQLYEQLTRGKSTSRIAFMAMQFGDSELDRIYNDYFKSGVAATGFNLKRVDEGQPAGLIDDRLRVEIRQCRFLIADLTHQNRGAYWEAGFAEGLGKPVIYTCRKDVFEDKGKGTHFDTNHHLTVVWDAGNLDDAVERLKATIRATLPDEASFGD